MQSRSLSAPPSGTNDTLVSPDRRRYRFRSGSGGGHGVFDLPPPGAEGKAVVHLSRVARARRAKGVRVVSQRTRSLRPEISRSSSSSASSSSLLSLSSAKSILKQRSQPSETEAAVVPASVAVVSVLQSVGQRPPSPQRLAGSAGPRRSLSMPQGNAKANSTTLAMGRGGREGKDVGLNLSQCDVNSDVFVTASSQELEEQVAMAESERKKEITTTMAIKTVMAGTGTMAENKRVRWLSPVSGSKTLLKATPKTHTSPRTSSSSSSTIDRDHASDVRADDDSDLGHEITHLPLPASTDDDIIPICSQGRYWTSHHQRRGSFVPEYAAKGARPPPPSPASSSASPVPWRKYAGQRSGDFGTVPTRAAGTAGKGEKGKTGRESRRRWYAVPPRLYGPPSTGLKKDSQRREQQPPPTEKGLSPAQRYLIEHLTSGSLHPEVEKYLNWLQSSSPTKISNSRGDGGESLTSSMRRLLLPRQKQGGETVLHPEVEKYLNWLQACPTTTQPPVETASDYSAPAEAGEAETSHGGHRGPGADAMPRHRVANNTDPKAARPINQKRSSLAWGWTAPEPKDDGPSPPGTVPKQIRKSALKKKHVTLASVPVSRATSPSSPTFRRSRGRSVPPASDRLTHRQQRPNHTQPPTAKEDGTSGAFTAEDVRSISPEWHVPGCVQPAARCRDSTHQVPRRAATDVKSTRGLAQPRPLKHSDNLPLGASSSRSIPDERRRARWLSLLEELHFSDKRQVVRDMATSRAHAAAASKSSSAPATPTMRAFVVDERELLALRERCGSSESADSDDTFVLPPASSSRASVVDCGVGTSDHTLNGDFQVTHKDHQDRRENRETTHSSSSVATSRDQQDSGVSFPTRTRRELFKALSSGKPRLFNRGIPSLSLKRKGGEEDETIKGSRIDGPFFDGRGGVHRGYWSPGRSTPAATALQGNDSRRFPDSALADFYPFEGGSKDGMR